MSFEPTRAADLPPLPKVRQMAMLVDVRNYAQLDLYAQIIIRSVPDDAHAHLACAWVASHFGFYQHYCDHLSAASKTQRSFDDLCSDLHIKRSELIEPKPFDYRNNAQQRFHLIKAWGFGFGSEMAALMSQAYLAEISGRTPIVHWGSNFLYRPSEGTNCVFDCFFEPFNALSIDDVLPVIDDCFPPKWTAKTLHLEHYGKKNGEQSKLSALHLLNRHEQLTVADYYAGVINIKPWVPEDAPISHLSFDDIYRYLAKKYLRPKQPIVQQVDAFVERNLSAPFVAVHVRGSDKDEGYRELTSIPGQTMAAVKQRLAALPSSSKLFLMTDDVALLARYQNEFGDRLVQTDCQRSNSDVGIHYDTTTDKESAGREMLIDMLVAARASCFIGLGLSNPSQLIFYFGNFSDDNYLLFGENRLKQFNTHLYRTISVT